jgi:hypothetical protein
MLVCGAIIQQWLLYSFVFRGRCLATSTCHIASSLRLFVQNSSQAYRHLFFIEGFALNASSLVSEEADRSTMSSLSLPIAQFCDLQLCGLPEDSRQSVFLRLRTLRRAGTVNRPRRLTARRRSPDRSFSAPIISAAAFSLGTS